MKGMSLPEWGLPITPSSLDLPYSPSCRLQKIDLYHHGKERLAVEKRSEKTRSVIRSSVTCTMPLIRSIYDFVTVSPLTFTRFSVVFELTARCLSNFYFDTMVGLGTNFTADLRDNSWTMADEFKNAGYPHKGSRCPQCGYGKLFHYTERHVRPLCIDLMCNFCECRFSRDGN
eukprot:g72782.t1